MSRSAEEIRDWIVARVSALARVAPEEIDPRAPVTRYGLDSVTLVALASDLEKWLGYRFRSNPLDEYPTIADLAQFLAEESASQNDG